VPSNWAAVGDAITAQLNEIGMQQKDLAAKSRVSVATIREIQAGKARRRGPRVLEDISKALGWPADYLPNLLQGKTQDQDQKAASETAVRTVESDPSAFLIKLATILEQRIGNVVDVIYNADSDVDITIEIRHSPREH
jgi:transcriptional regulator with XRE-family HTH domain